MVESGALEKRCAFTGAVGSNPTLSAANVMSEEEECVHFCTHMWDEKPVAMCEFATQGEHREGRAERNSRQGIY